MTKVRIIYPEGIGGLISEEWKNEAEAMRQVGFETGILPEPDDERLIYRGPSVRNVAAYPSDSRYVNDWKANRLTQFMSLHFHLISNVAIPTFFLEKSQHTSFKPEIEKRGWERVFIRSDSKSLYFDDINKCIWPDNDLAKIIAEYEKYGLKGPFAVRKYIDDPQIFYDEQRYWILNGNAYHSSGIIPEVIQDIGKKLYMFSGSSYFTIDMAGDYIVEINPGESSDRGCDNPQDFFCHIFQREFLDK